MCAHKDLTACMSFSSFWCFTTIWLNFSLSWLSSSCSFLFSFSFFLKSWVLAFFLSILKSLRFIISANLLTACSNIKTVLVRIYIMYPFNFLLKCIGFQSYANFFYWSLCVNLHFYGANESWVVVQIINTNVSFSPT